MSAVSAVALLTPEHHTLLSRLTKVVVRDKPDSEESQDELAKGQNGKAVLAATEQITASQTLMDKRIFELCNNKLALQLSPDALDESNHDKTID